MSDFRIIEVKFRFSDEFRTEEEYQNLYKEFDKVLVDDLKFADHVVTSNYFLFTNTLNVITIKQKIDEVIEKHSWVKNDFIVISVSTVKVGLSLYVNHYKKPDGEWVMIAPADLYNLLRSQTIVRRGNYS